MSLTAFYDEEVVEAGDTKLTLAIDFRAIDIIEGLAGGPGEIVPMPTVLAWLFTPPASIGLSGKVLWALLRRHHDDVSLDQAAGLMFHKEHGPKVGQAIDRLLSRAFNLVDETKAKDKNPPKRRGASKGS